jgi:hypothetical protein
MRFLKFTGVTLLIFAAIYFLGPHPSPATFNNTLPNIPSITELDSFVHVGEKLHKIKPNNEAKIVWADSTKGQTEYVIYI